MTTPPNRRLPGGVFLVASFLAGAALSATLVFTFDTSSTAAKNGEEQLSNSASDGSPSAIGNTDKKLTNLSALSQFENEFERNLALYNHVDRLGIDRLLELLAESKGIEPSVQLNTQRVILERLAALDPKLAMSRAKSMVPTLTSTIFFQWSLMELDEAIAYANSLDLTRRDAALRGILTSRVDLPEEDRLEIGRQFGNEELARSTINSSKLDEYLNSPGESWDEIVEEAQHDPLQIGLLHTLAQRWFEQEGLDVLPKLSATLTNERTRDSVLGSVVHMAAKRDPQGTFFELVLGDASNINNEIVFDVARRLARSDPKSALNAVTVLDETRLKRSLLNLVMQAWADDDPEALLAELEQFTGEVKALGLEVAINAIARTTPERAVPLIARIEDITRKNNAVYIVASHWSRQDPNAALNWVLTDGEV